MKIQIRQGVFETNSSSVHTISITCGVNAIPDSVRFSLGGEFGWSPEVHSDVHSKASYLYLAMVENLTNSDSKNFDEMLEGVNQYKEYVEEVLKAAGVKEIEWEELSLRGGSYGLYIDTPGYIDHGYELGNWLNDLRKPDLLLAFLFCENSAVYTGNDNCDEEPAGDPNSDYEYTKTN